MPVLRLITALLLALSFNSHAADNLKTYQQAAQQLLSSLEKHQHPQKDSAGIEQQAKQLVELSKPLLADFKSKYPQCTDYLDALNSVADTLANLPLADIESGYHSDGKLPPLPDANCYHAKDLLVHPATVQAMAQKGLKTVVDWEQAEAEIEEVIEHFTQVEIAYQQ